MQQYQPDELFSKIRISIVVLQTPQSTRGRGRGRGKKRVEEDDDVDEEDEEEVMMMEKSKPGNKKTAQKVRIKPCRTTFCCVIQLLMCHCIDCIVLFTNVSHSSSCRFCFCCCLCLVFIHKPPVGHVECIVAVFVSVNYDTKLLEIIITGQFEEKGIVQHT